MINRTIKVFAALSLLLVFQLTANAQMMGSSTTGKSGPLPAPEVEGLDDYYKQLLFASRNIEEGDYPSAIENLHKAEKLKTDDPMLYEMLGIVYDADRQSEIAFNYFSKAGEMYFERDDIKKALRMLGWMNTFAIKSDYVKEFEIKLRKKQEVVNREREEK